MTDTIVADVMTTPALTVEPDTSLTSIANAMLDEEIKSIAIIDEECDPVGILTSTDFIQAVSDDAVSNATVGDYMTDEVLTIYRSQSVQDAAELMLEHGVSHIPVVNDEDVIGIVTATDVTEHVAASDDS